MAKEIITDYSASTKYAVINQIETGLFWNGSSFESRGQSSWTTYAIPLTNNAETGESYCDMPSVPYGRYFVTIYEQEGAAPADTDDNVAEGEFDYRSDFDSHLPVPSALQGYKADLWEAIQQWGETITWLSQGGTTKEIKAIVDRTIPTRLPSTNTAAPGIEITILNDDTLGVNTIIIGGDKVQLPERINGTLKTYLVTLIVLQDEACWKIKV